MVNGRGTAIKRPEWLSVAFVKGRHSRHRMGENQMSCGQVLSLAPLAPLAERQKGVNWPRIGGTIS